MIPYFTYKFYKNSIKSDKFLLFWNFWDNQWMNESAGWVKDGNNLKKEDDPKNGGDPKKM